MADQQDDVRALLNDFGETTVEWAIARARQEVNRFDNVVLNIAVTGETGAGKSSLVNAMRGLDDNDEGAAATGVTETTEEPAMYPHPNMPNVRIWDLPGTGSNSFKAKTYIQDVKFQDYDIFILVSAKRFKENYIMLAKELKKKEKNFIFVRSLIDQDVEAEKRKGKTEEQTLQIIWENCKKNLTEVGSHPIFLISSFYPEKFEFKKLLKNLESGIPDHKRNALVVSLPVHSRQSLEEKYYIFKDVALGLAAVSDTIAVAPVPGLSPACDFAILVGFLTECYFSFGLNDKSLKKLSKRVDKPILEMVRESSLVVAIAGRSLLTTKMAARLGAAGAIEALCSLVPVAGSPAAAGVSYVTTKSVLLEGLNELYGVARRVLEMAELE